MPIRHDDRLNVNANVMSDKYPVDRRRFDRMFNAVANLHATLPQLSHEFPNTLYPFNRLRGYLKFRAIRSLRSNFILLLHIPFTCKNDWRKKEHEMKRVRKFSKIQI